MQEAKTRGMNIEPPRHVEIIGGDIKILETKVQAAALNACTFFLLIQTDNEQIHRKIFFYKFFL